MRGAIPPNISIGLRIPLVLRRMVRDFAGFEMIGMSLGIAIWFDVDGDLGYFGQLLEDSLFDALGDIVAGGNGNVRIDLDVSVGQDVSPG